METSEPPSRHQHRRRDVIWSAFCLNEIWADITTDISHLLFVAVLYIFVLSTVGGRYHRIHKVTTDLLKQIDTLR